MTQPHRVLIAPGLDGRVWGMRLVTRNWHAKYGLLPESIPIVWKDSSPLAPKLQTIIDRIDYYSNMGNRISLVGSSASGSLMLNAFVKRKSKIYKVVNLGGFVRPGNATGIRSFDRRSASSIAFKESVLRCTQVEPKLSLADRKKILTVRPRFGDELVPPETVVIKGAQNTAIPLGEHIVTIAAAFLMYKPMIAFLAGEE